MNIFQNVKWTYQREHFPYVSAYECYSTMCLTWSTAALLCVNITGGKLAATINQKLDFLLYTNTCKLFLADSYDGIFDSAICKCEIRSPNSSRRNIEWKIFQMN